MKAVPTFWGEPTWSAVVVCVLIGTGGIAALVSSRRRWVTAALVLTTALVVLREVGGVEIAAPLTWPWWNDVYRLRALVVLPAILCMVAGVQWIDRALRNLHVPASSVTATIAAITVLLVAAQAPAGSERLSGYFEATGLESWVTADEADALRAISKALPDDALVAANPWNGGTYLAVVGPERLLYPTEKVSVGHAADYVGLRLNDAATDPKVCESVNEVGLTHVLTGGDPYFGHDNALYIGIDRVTESDAFELLFQAGPYRAYAIKACAG